MTDMSMILHFLFSGVATAGFAVFFNAPLYLLLPAGVTGGIGWIVYVYLFNFTTNAVFAGFIAAALVSACSETLAKTKATSYCVRNSRYSSSNTRNWAI